MIKEILSKYEPLETNILPALKEIEKNKEKKYISYDEIKIISEYFNMPASKIKGIITFYSLLSDKPRGKYIIRICDSPPCYINGSTNILEELKKELKIDIGETTEDGLFTLETTACLGECYRGPSMMINNKIYSELNRKKIKEILKEYKK